LTLKLFNGIIMCVSILVRALIWVIEYLFSFSTVSASTKATMDYPLYGQIFFQDPATPSMEGLVEFHHDLTGLLLWIGIFVLWMIFSCVRRFIAQYELAYGYHPY
jgi:hypothetical protein